MTLSEYTAAVTEIMDGGPGCPCPREYPPTFETDVALLFQRRFTAAEAAEKLALEYDAETDVAPEHRQPQ